MYVFVYNTNKPEDSQMKTNRNFKSKITRAFIIITLAFTTLVNTSSQSTAQQSFCYRTDFVKQMVNQISNDFYTRTVAFSASCQNNTINVAAIPVKYTISTKLTNTVTISNLNGLLDFLTNAAKLNAPQAKVEVETDITLDFLTQAARLNAPVADITDEQDNTLEFLTTAAQLYAPVAEDKNQNDDTLDFLINAAQLNTPVASEESNQTNDILEFLTQAANLNGYIAE